MLISDVIKKTKGQLTTSADKPAEFKSILGAFQEWKDNWQQNICQA